MRQMNTNDSKNFLVFKFHIATLARRTFSFYSFCLILHPDCSRGLSLLFLQNKSNTHSKCGYKKYQCAHLWCVCVLIGQRLSFFLKEEKDLRVLRLYEEVWLLYSTIWTWWAE